MTGAGNGVKKNIISISIQKMTSLTIDVKNITSS